MLHVTGRLSGAQRLYSVQVYTGVKLGTAQVYRQPGPGAGKLSSAQAVDTGDTVASSVLRIVT